MARRRVVAVDRQERRGLDMTRVEHVRAPGRERTTLGHVIKDGGDPEIGSRRSETCPSRGIDFSSPHV